MAVQMMTSSAEEHLSFTAASDGGIQHGASSGDGAFRDALASASSEDGQGGKAQTATAPRRTSPVQKQAKKADAVAQGTAADPQAEVEQLDAAPVAQVIMTDAETLQAMLDAAGIEHVEADIDELVADAMNGAARQSRFDPDAILDALTAKPTVTIEDLGEAEPADEDAAADALLAKVVASMQSAEPQQLANDLIEEESDDQIVVGADESGEIALKNIPSDGEAQTAEVQAAENTEVEHLPSKAEAPDRKVAEVAPEQIEAGEDQADEVQTVETKPTAEPKVDDKKGEGQNIDERLAALVDRYRERRESLGQENAGADARDRQKQPQLGAQQRKDSVKEARRTSNQIERSTTDRPDHATREVAFGETLASKIREAEDSMPTEAPASRAGMTYQLVREEAFTDGMKNVLEFMRVDGTHEARIVVEPPALGHIDISLRATESGMNAVFKVDSEHLKQMVQQHLDILKSSLQSQGIHVSNIAVDIRNKDDQNGQGAAHAKNGKKGRRAAGVEEAGDVEETVQLTRLDLEQGLLHWIG